MNWPLLSNDSRVCVRHYRSLIGLRRHWEWLDCRDGAQQLTVVLALDPHFSGDWQALVRRLHPALRLIIAAPSGHLSGHISACRLADSAGALGWREVVFERDAHAAITRALESLRPDDHCVVFWPDWLELQGPAEAM